MMNKFFLLSTVFFCLTGCASVSYPDQNSIVEETISYSTSRCFGACPVYSVTIQPGGAVHFNGEQFTKVVGEQNIIVSPGIYKKLSSQLSRYKPAPGKVENNFNCVNKATDHQTVSFVWMDKSGVETKLDHYMGCMNASDKSFNQFIEQLPEMLGINDLIR